MELEGLHTLSGASPTMIKPIFFAAIAVASRMRQEHSESPPSRKFRGSKGLTNPSVIQIDTHSH